MLLRLFQVQRRYRKLQHHQWKSLMGVSEEVEYLLPEVDDRELEHALNGSRLVHIKDIATSLQSHEVSWKRIRTQNILIWDLAYSRTAQEWSGPIVQSSSTQQHPLKA